MADDGNQDLLDRSVNKRILIEGTAARIGRGDMPGFADGSMLANLHKIAGGNSDTNVTPPRHSLTLRIELRAINQNSIDQAITIKSVESLIGGHMFSAKLRAADAHQTTLEHAAGKTIVSDAIANGESVASMMKKIDCWLKKNLPDDQQREAIEASIAKYLLVVLQQNELHKGDFTIKQGTLKDIVASIDALAPPQQRR